MRYTAKITLVIGFTVSSAVTLVLKRTGTGFRAMTSVLYLYGFTCLAGGIIGYRKAYLKHGEGREDAGIKHILGIDRLRQFLKTGKWIITTEKREMVAEKLKVHGKLVSMELEDGKKLSYPRKSVEKLEKLSP